MAVTFKHLLEPIDPVQPTIRLGAVLARFTAEPDLEILPVVFGRTLVGTLQRRVVFELAGSDIPRTDLTDARIAPLLNGTPATVDGETRIGGFCAKDAKAKGPVLENGVVVLDAGAYAGVVRAPVIARALAEENAKRARAQKGVATKIAAYKSQQAISAAQRAKVQALLAHELRTPLNAAQAGAEMLQQHTSSNDGRLLARTVSDACEALDRLLDDMMTLSEADLGSLPVRPEPVSLKRFAADLEGLWRQKAVDNGLDYGVNLGKLAAERVEVDSVRLRQLTDNLVSNAIKYTPEGRVEVVLGTVASDAGLTLRIEVTDTGPGLTGEDIQRVFQPFTRTGTATAIEGSGLGLTVVKAVTARLGGEIAYRTGETGGSVFSLTLPVHKAGPRIVSENRRAAAMRRFEIGDVLLVDDHEPSRVVLAKALLGAGWRVDGVHSLAQALRRAAHKPYQAILCDLHLLDGNGIDLLNAVRGGETHDRTTPVIAVTADRSQARMDRCRAAGFDAVWTKPIKPNDAVMALADLIIAHEAATREAGVLTGPRSAIA
ncbi:MAG: ATP-binding protein [Pseudomonadota bacterium]